MRDDEIDHNSWVKGFDAACFRWDAAFVAAFISGITLGLLIAIIIVETI